MRNIEISKTVRLIQYIRHILVRRTLTYYQMS